MSGGGQAVPRYDCCRQTFEGYLAYSAHLKEFHPEKAPSEIPCGRCGKKFTIGKLWRHEIDCAATT